MQIGTQAPDFELRDQHGATVRLSSYLGRKAVAVMFFPYAFSRVCTRELEDVRDNLAAFEHAGAALVAISCDPMFSLRALAERDAITFPLLSDFWPHGRVATVYGAFDEERGCAGRATFVVDASGVLRWTRHSPTPDARDLREQARALEEAAGSGHRES